MTSREWRVLMALMVIEYASASSLTMVFPGLATWLRIYHDPVHVGWIVTAYLLVSAAAAAVFGRLGDLYGRRRMLMVVGAVALTGSLISAFAPNLPILIAGRALQGLYGAVLPLCLGLVRENFRSENAPKGMGLVLAAAGAAAAVAFLTGGLLIDNFGVQSIFFALSLTAALGFAAAWLGLPAGVRMPSIERFDWLGGILFAPAIALVLLALGSGRSWGWTSPWTLAPVGLGTAMLAFWWRHELRVAKPLIDVRLLANSRTALTNGAVALTAMGVMQMIEVLSLLLQQPSWTGVGLELSATLVGLIKFPGLVLGMLISAWTGWVAARRGPTLPMLTGGGLMLVAAVGGALGHDSLALLFVISAIGTAGVTATYTGSSILIASEAPAVRVSEAAGLMAVSRAMFQGIGAQFIAILLGMQVVVDASGTRFPAKAAYITVLGYMAVTALLIILISVALRRTSVALQPAAPALES